MFRALRWRLAISNALILVVLFSGISFGGLTLFRLRTDEAATRELEGFADDLSARVAIGGAEMLMDHHDHPSDAAILVGLFGPGATFLDGTLPHPAWLMPQDDPVMDRLVDGDRTRFATEPVRLPDGSEGLIVVARSLDRLDAQIDELEEIVTLTFLASVLLSAAIGWWISGRMIRPVARSYEAQRDFASDASHELRTPLTFIRAGVELLAPGRPDLGKQVIDEIDYMTALTDRLLVLARAERGDLRVAATSFDVTEAIRSSAERSRVAHGTHLETDPASGPTLATGDPYLAETVLDVILENVARHGGGSARIGCEVGMTSVIITVADSGRGMDADDRDRVFVRFARLEKSRDRGSGGSGLGLPLARSLAKAQNGELHLSATPGGGLTATLELPRA